MQILNGINYDMSFVRVGGRNPPKKKRTVKPKPWNDTVNDLDAYKATPDEIAYRKAAHRSKHAVSTHLTRPGSARKGKRASPFKNNSQARKIAIMKEVLYDQKQLQDVLEKSDTMMAVVKDLFGDDPRVRMLATFDLVNTRCNIFSSGLSTNENIRAGLKKNSHVLPVMTGFFFTDLDDSHPIPLSYQPKMNMQRFQQFLEAEEKNTTLSTISGQAGMSHLDQMLNSQLNSKIIQSSQLPDLTAATSKDGSFQTPPKNKKHLDESLEILQPPKSAINDTNKINKTKPRVPKPQPEHNTSNLTLNELRKVLETLEDEVAEYERLTGRRPPAERHRQESFSGYTLAIVDSVTKLTRYLRECELRLHAEITVREQLTQDVVQSKALVDALTSDIIVTQEEFQTMSAEFRKFRQETQAEIARLKGEQPPSSQQWSPAQSDNSNPAEPVQTQTPPKAQQYHQGVQNVPSKLPKEINPFGEHLQPVSAAVMLSPPVRRSRVGESEKNGARQQGSLLDYQEYISSVESSTLHDDFVELPGLCTTSLAQVLNPNSVSQQPVRGQSGEPVSQSQVRVPETVQVNSVNVPRPTPLVQSNVGIPLPSDSSGLPYRGSQQLPLSFYEKNQPISVVPKDRPQTLRSNDQNNSSSQDQSNSSERSHDHMAAGADRDFLASQIAELNKQHAEAQKRLNSLMHQQQAGHGQNELAQQQQRQQEIQQQQDQQARQQVVQNQQRIQQQQQLQQQQQQRLLQMVMQQQQRIQEQQQQQKQQQLQEQQLQQQQLQQQQQQNQRPRPALPGEMTNGTANVRQSTELPGYRPVQIQPGLPAYPVSPNISPISQKPDSYRMMFQSVDSQDTSVSAPLNRGITVSLPKVDMDQSYDSPSPNPPQTAI
ncbi:alpha-protein kinase 1-like [Ruditapes philippinarum]|uniref:alpha-protein kinase 1-like n=1 Tax=Ruditapes philippinarum TaxID=129788 RepID=UPI00295BBD3D|nr:alpha-protein kinase 1-like [Ruditapes philippinarum]